MKVKNTWEDGFYQEGIEIQGEYKVGKQSPSFFSVEHTFPSFSAIFAAKHQTYEIHYIAGAVYRIFKS